jgi:hypothetical protein
MQVQGWSSLDSVAQQSRLVVGTGTLKPFVVSESDAERIWDGPALQLHFFLQHLL